MHRFTPQSPWVREDNRRNRAYNTVTAGSLNAKCAACLPEALIAGRSVLDLGCCIGHAGWWALSNGASCYCGVEVQGEYVRAARRLFGEHLAASRYDLVEDDLIHFLETDTREFDVVLLAGITYGFVDPLHLLRLSARRASILVIDTRYPATLHDGDGRAYLEFVPDQRMILARDDVKHASAAGSRFSPAGLDVVMANYGFDAEAVSVPPILDCEDVYNTPRPNAAGGHYPLRYVRRYVRSGERLLSVGEGVALGRVSNIVEMYNPDGMPA